MILFILLLLSYNCAILTSASNNQEKYYVACKDQKTYKVPESPPITIQSPASSLDASPVLFGVRYLELMRKNSEEIADKRLKAQQEKAKKLLEEKEKIATANFAKCMQIVAVLGEHPVETLKKIDTGDSELDEDSDDRGDKSSSSDDDLFNLEL